MQVGVNLQVRAYLQGPYEASTGFMKDNLRSRGLIPQQQPYSSAPFLYAGTETLNRSLTSISLGGDANALVDWVLLELRSTNSPAVVVAQKAVGLQADGDLMDVQTGATTLAFLNVSAGDYYVSVRHRNHLGVVSASAQALSFMTKLVDFSKPSVAVMGQNSRLLTGNLALLWAGDINQDKKVIANGVGNDSNVLISTVLGASGNSALNTSYKLAGYVPSDLNLDGDSVAVGPSNDNTLIHSNVLTSPANPNLISNFILGGNGY
ncbi:MAG TPA: hypothetical protein PLM98_03805 [Thiolinea sp.]|nr:hypothetical protein [Thiolinea sp.]